MPASQPHPPPRQGQRRMELAHRVPAMITVRIEALGSVVGVDVVLNAVDQPGTSPRRRRLTQLDAVPDSRDVFAGICGRSKLPMLRRVDPYGDLILTPSDMHQFMEE